MRILHYAEWSKSTCTKSVLACSSSFHPLGSPWKGDCVRGLRSLGAGEDLAGDQTVEFRLTTPNAWKLWVNGKMLFGREEYHRTPSSLVMDLYRVPVKLKAGKNRILLKICQNEQDDDWAQRYEFRIRVCDETGSAVRPETRHE